ncbi:hypothetical protein C427_1076 [Paraglaciecola psychrophila 170]|uniref:Uncharacterized protein n=1 Tax=Paraglaciecola psychrophila 170 TaxID=1129794 RepID=M4RI16_9ALTE|nr:hypothetical protein C427_1076 [Paraglaciecola psychrophila 170]
MNVPNGTENGATDTTHSRMSYKFTSIKIVGKKLSVNFSHCCLETVS